MRPLFHIVLHEPEIPTNTGNIGRTCVATACALHLIHPLGFDLSEKACRRAGLDYWPRLSVREHADWNGWERAWEKGLAGDERTGAAAEAVGGSEGLPVLAGPARVWYFTTKATRSFFDASFARGDAMVFGKESAGLPASVLEAAPPERLVTLPMVPGERSLNLATAVSNAIYEGVRHVLARGEARLDERGRLLV